MKQELGQHAVNVAQSPKTAAAVSTVATAAGLGTVLNFIPGVLGLVTMSLGISLQLVLRRKGRLESEKIQLQKEKLQLEIDMLESNLADEPSRKDVEGD